MKIRNLLAALSATAFAACSVDATPPPSGAGASSSAPTKPLQQEQAAVPSVSTANPAAPEEKKDATVTAAEMKDEDGKKEDGEKKSD